jgi:hypothetical protein
VSRTPVFHKPFGYGFPAAGGANLAISTNAVAERFKAIAMTLEMPFKDHDDAPEPVRAWSVDRSRALGETCIRALADIIDQFQ